MKSAKVMNWDRPINWIALSCILILIMVGSTVHAQEDSTEAPVDDGLGPFFKARISGPSARLTIINGETVWGLQPAGLTATVGWMHTRQLMTGLTASGAPTYWNGSWSVTLNSRLFAAYTVQSESGLGFRVSPGVNFFHYFAGPVEGSYIAPSVQAGVGLGATRNFGFSANLEVGYQYALGAGSNGFYVVPSLGLGISL